MNPTVVMAWLQVAEAIAGAEFVQALLAPIKSWFRRQAALTEEQKAELDQRLTQWEDRIARAKAAAEGLSAAAGEGDDPTDRSRS
jgi:multidrug efflux pump subunit AcrA (membrane-fusion protein)